VKLLGQYKAEVNLEEENGRTALFFGILLNFGLNLNYLFYYFNILAAEKGHFKIVEFLCQNYAEVNHKGYNRDTALILGMLFN
jgi:hypothetical protein